jgi:hypothetical protein
MTAVGCSESSAPVSESETVTKSAANTPETSSLPEGLFLAGAPEGAKPITELKQSAEEGDEVVVEVFIGGRPDPIVGGRASASIIDSSVENICLSEADHCPTPWDYCCASPEEVTANLATLQVINEDGRVMPADLSKQMKPLSKLVIRGVAGPRPNDQVLIINATGIFVEPAM